MTQEKGFKDEVPEQELPREVVPGQAKDVSRFDFVAT
jgi:hypothetical protein